MRVNSTLKYPNNVMQQALRQTLVKSPNITQKIYLLVYTCSLYLLYFSDFVFFGVISDGVGGYVDINGNPFLFAVDPQYTPFDCLSFEAPALVYIGDGCQYNQDVFCQRTF